MRFSIPFLFPFMSIFILLVGCTSTQPINDINENYSSNIKQREEILAQLSTWEVKGKIAFINSVERQSASLFWQKKKHSQQLNLTTYLGINVFKLTSNKNIHTIEVGGETYTSSNLNQLFGSLTNFSFPTQALSFWIKAIQYSSNDVFTFSPISYLPLTLTSHYNNIDWVIHYASYQTIQQGELTIALPNKIKITSPDLTINIAINNWTL